MIKIFIPTVIIGSLLFAMAYGLSELSIHLAWKVLLGFVAGLCTAYFDMFMKRDK
jgi:hypothetical protein